MNNGNNETKRFLQKQAAYRKIVRLLVEYKSSLCIRIKKKKNDKWSLWAFMTTTGINSWPFYDGDFQAHFC